MKARIDKAAFIGWRGIQYEELDFGENVLTGLVGVPGAGKTTFAFCLAYALLPDRKIMDIKPVSGLSNAQNVGTDELAGKIDPAVGFAYVALDVITRRGERLVIGIHVRVIEGRGEITRWTIPDVERDVPLQNLLRVVTGDEEAYPDFPELRSSLARNGHDLKTFRSVSDYGQALFDAGIAPFNLMDSVDRSLYARLIESTFRGGISAEVSTKLKDYLLPEVNRIPESVSRLEECRQQILKTRSTLDQAQQQLNILSTTYGTGKEIIVTAVSAVASKKSLHSQHIVMAESRIAIVEGTLQANALTRSSLDTEMGVLSKIRDDRSTDLMARKKAALPKLLALGGELATLNQAKIEVEQKLATFERGSKAWHKAITDLGEMDSVDQAAAALKKGIEGLQNIRATKLATANNLTLQITRLKESKTTRSTQLADMLNVQSLEEVYDNVLAEDAVSLELSLAGLTEGLVGLPIEALLTLPDSDQFPEVFWLKSRLSDIESAQRIGAWNVLPVADGYLVSSDRKPLTLGRTTRAAQASKLEIEVKKLTDEIADLSENEKKLGFRRDGLLSNTDQIIFYLSTRSTEQVFRRECAEKAQAFTDKSEEVKTARAFVESVDAQINEIVGPINTQLATLAGLKVEAVSAGKGLEGELVDLRKRIEQAVPELQKTEADLGLMKETLGVQFDALLVQAQELGEQQREGYLIEQTRRIQKLAQALGEALPGQLAIVDLADPSDEVSCVQLWPMLMDVIRDQVSMDVADTDGEDLLRTMQQRRSVLGSDLERQHSELKHEAKNLYRVIASEIQRQTIRIQRLSALGERLRFGNVSGIAIRVRNQEDFLGVLEQIAEQPSLFESDSADSVEERLGKLFSAKLGTKVNGRSLMDYRTYMEVVIEAHRTEGWIAATALSGAEAIGCGLAIALMLARSLAARSEGGRQDFRMMFPLDEIQRVGKDGQRLISEFGRHEGFQVLVTALELEPDYNCNIYVIKRTTEPAERVEVRKGEYQQLESV